MAGHYCAVRDQVRYTDSDTALRSCSVIFFER
jgi:hypothetical protein